MIHYKQQLFIALFCFYQVVIESFKNNWTPAFRLKGLKGHFISTSNKSKVTTEVAVRVEASLSGTFFRILVHDLEDVDQGHDVQHS